MTTREKKKNQRANQLKHHSNGFEPFQRAISKSLESKFNLYFNNEILVLRIED